MTAAPANKNIPDALKRDYRGWPISNVVFEDLLQRARDCRHGVVAAGRFSKPLHTAYLVDLETEALYRCVRELPMRVQLRRVLRDVEGVRMLQAEASA